jgi:hypothetical protein
MRQIKLLNGRHDLFVAGFGVRPEGWVGKYIQIKSPDSYTITRKLLLACQLMMGLFDSFYWRERHIKDALSLLGNESFDIVLANDIHALPLAFELKSKAGVFYDAHEYSPLEFSENFKWKITLGRFNSYLCKKYLKKLSAMTTVCDGIAQAYAKKFGVTPSVVYNSPLISNLNPIKNSSTKISLVHHGAALESRCLELMIEMMMYLDDRFHLDFYLVNSKPNYYKKLIELAKSCPRIRFLEPVKMECLPQTINKYDVGIYLLKPVNFNSEYALPNKFFEFVQGSVAIAVGPSPEMARLVEKHNMGIVAESFDPKDLATALNGLTHEKIWEYKMAANQAAQKLNYQQAGLVMLTEIDRCLSKRVY